MKNFCYNIHKQMLSWGENKLCTRMRWHALLNNSIQEAEYINILSNFYETYSTKSSLGFQQVVILEEGEYLIQKCFKEYWILSTKKGYKRGMYHVPKTLQHVCAHKVSRCITDWIIWTTLTYTHKSQQCVIYFMARIKILLLPG